jgi:PEGA domain
MGRRRRFGRQEHSGITASLTLVPLDGTPTDTEVTRPYVLDWRMLEEPTVQLGVRAIKAKPRTERPRKPPPPLRRRPPQRVASPPPRCAEATQIIRRRLPTPAPTPTPPPPAPVRSMPEVGLVIALFVALAILGTILALLLRPLVAQSSISHPMHAASVRLTVPPAVFAPTVLAPAPRPATLSFRSSPRATIVLDGKKIGRTPKRAVRVPAGEHLVQFLHHRLGRRDQTIDVDPGATRTVVARF